MDYNKLKTFLIVAEEMSVTRAAARLLRTQSAVTQQLQLLENDLGVALLHRKKARIFLTAEGESIYRVASESYSQVETHLADLLSRTQSVAGVIRIGMIADFGGELVLRSIEEFKARYPRVDFHVSYGMASEAVENRLLQNEVDFGLLITFRNKALFRAEPVLEQNHILVASKRYLAAHGPVKSYRELADARLIDFTDDLRSFRAWLKRNGRAVLPELKLRRANMVIQNQLDAKTAVMKGLGVAVLPIPLIKSELAGGRLVKVIEGSKPVRSGLDLAWKRKQTPKLILTTYRDTLLKIAADHRRSAKSDDGKAGH
jgi:DNA-binding transcriptional LysR family regulator